VYEKNGYLVQTDRKDIENVRVIALRLILFCKGVQFRQGEDRPVLADILAPHVAPAAFHPYLKKTGYPLRDQEGLRVGRLSRICHTRPTDTEYHRQCGLIFPFAVALPLSQKRIFRQIRI
jgi:hypothetical protein